MDPPYLGSKLFNFINFIAEKKFKKMKRLRVVSEGILYRNPTPGYKAECAYLPNLQPLSDTEYICVIRIGSAFYSADGKLALLRTRDGGNTWVKESLVWDPRLDKAAYSYTAPHLTKLSNGTLILVARRWDSSDPELPIFNPETGGMRCSEVILFHSQDNGKTWSPPQLVDLPGQGQVDVPSQIIELRNGRWLMACELWKAWEDTSPLHVKGFAVFSDDLGKTWKDRLDFASSSDTQRMFSHSRYTQTLEGRVAALQWAQEIETGKDLELHLTISDESGREWSEPSLTNIEAQTSWLADLGGGVFAVTYTHRSGINPGICVALSENGGTTWDLENQVLVWDAVGQEFLGVSHKPSYPASHDNIAFGKPHTVRLSSVDFISSWWCTQACVTHCRFARLTVD
jgi:hypothetical protein